MKVTIDRADCISCAVCWEDCPDFFAQNPGDNLGQVCEPYRVDERLDLGLAPSELEDCTRLAAERCPVGVIHLEP